MLTTDRNDPALKAGQQNETGQHDVYLVLSEQERAKGFVRPVRSSYLHAGKMPSYKGIWRMLDEQEANKFPGKNYVALMTVLTDEDGNPCSGSYVNAAEFDAWQKGIRVGGCGNVTTMGTALAETYARQPDFYGATFCTRCNKHLPVEEFVWKDTNEQVGS